MRADRLLGPVIVLLALVWLALVYADIPAGRSEVEPGPRGFPILLGVALLVIGALMSVSAWAGAGRTAPPQGKPVTRHEAFVVASTFGLLMLYGYLMQTTGFLISTPLAVLLMMAGILKIRNWFALASMAIGITATLWIFFVKILGAPMPHGSWLWLL